MSRGLGRVQQAAMALLSTGKALSAFQLAAVIYGVTAEPGGKRTLSKAQRSAVRRALASLQRRGLAFQCGRNKLGRAVWMTRELAEAHPDLIPEMLGTRSSVERWHVIRAMVNRALRASGRDRG